MLAMQLLAGQRRALARALSLVEDESAEARDLLAATYPHTGRAHVIGVTGAPGTGKSTLVGRMAQAYRQQGERVGILAVDPTSPFSGGALLGDRLRMRDLVGDEGVFIRSMATRGSLGGLSRATAAAIHLLDAAGYGRILVETVGAGQSEVDIATTAHTTVVVEAPGLGDDVQAIKAGILEVADVFAVNKADQEGVERTVLALQNMLHLAERPADPRGAPGQMTPGMDGAANWTPPICRTVALQGEGIDDLLAAIEAHRQHLQESGQGVQLAVWRARRELESVLQQELLRHLLARLSEGELAAWVQQIVQRQVDPYRVAVWLMNGERVEG